MEKLVLPRTRILFMAESITLAHVVRPLGLAVSMKSQGHEVYFACSEKYRPWVEAKGLNSLPIHSLDSQIFQKRLSQGKTFLRKDEVLTQVQENLQVLHSLQPEVVLGDFRLSLGISARVARIPYIGIVNAYWLHFEARTMPVPEIPMTTFLGRRASHLLFSTLGRWIVPRVLEQQAHDFNLVRKQYNQSPLRRVIDCYLEADFLALADVPELVPHPPSRSGAAPWLYLGPLTGNLPCELPPWWTDLSPYQPIVYLNLGSSGRQDLVPRLVQSLQTLPIQIIIGGPHENLQTPGKVFVARQLPGDQICARAELVICNGGAPSVYQALLQGKQVLGITHNLDQRTGMPFYARHPFIHHLRSWDLDFNFVHETVAKILSDQEKQIQAQEFAKVLPTYDITERLQMAIHQVLAQKFTFHCKTSL